MEYRLATLDDVPLLAKLNQQLVQDERHRNARMTLQELEDRMQGFLSGAYEAVLFSDSGETVAYALFRDDEDTIYLRQLFVSRDRRRQGLGREATDILRHHVWPKDKRIVTEVLCHNSVGHTFWKAVGFKEYSIALELPPVQENAEPSGGGDSR